MSNIDIDELPEKIKSKILEEHPDLAKKSSKYYSRRIKIDGYTFDSKKEADRYTSLKNLERIGAIKFFIRQPKFDLGGGCTYSADFLVFWKDGTYTIEDVKGFETKEFKLKKKLIESRYPIKIEIR